MARGGIKPWQFLAGMAVILVIILAATASSPNPVNTNLKPFTQAVLQTSTASQNLCPASKPIAVTVFDALGGSGVNAPTVTLYRGSTQLESSAASSSGVFTSGGTYNTGDQINFKVSGASTATEYLNNVAIPPISCGNAATNNAFSAYAVILQTWTISIAGQGGTAFTSSTTVPIYLSQLPGGTTGTSTITVTFGGQNNNQGYVSSSDVTNAFSSYSGLSQQLVVELKDTSTSLTISGMPRAITSGSTRYWQVICPDGIQGTGWTSTGTFTVANNVNHFGQADPICVGSASQQKVGNTVYGGAFTFSFGVAAGGVASGSSETISVSGWKYADVNYFALNVGSYGPNAAQIGAPVGSSSGTTFSLKFLNG